MFIPARSAGGGLTGTTGVPPVAGAAHGPSDPPPLPGVQLTRARDMFAWIHEREEESLNCIEEISSRPTFAGVWRIRGVQNSSRWVMIVQAVDRRFRHGTGLKDLELS